MLKSPRNNLLKHDLSVGENPVKWQYIADFFQTDHCQLCGHLYSLMLTRSDRRFETTLIRHLKIDRVRSAPPHENAATFNFDKLTLISKCSRLFDLSNQSGRIAWLKRPEYRDYICTKSGGIGLH